MRRPNTSASTVALRWRPQLQSQSNAPDQARARSPLRREASVGSFRLSSMSSYGKYEALPQRLIEFASRGGGDTPKQPDLTLGLHMAPLYVGTPASEHPHEPRPARKSLTRGFMTGMPMRIGSLNGAFSRPSEPSAKPKARRPGDARQRWQPPHSDRPVSRRRPNPRRHHKPPDAKCVA